MHTLAQHIEQNRRNIEEEAAQYAKSHGVSLEVARRDVEAEYAQGWHEAADDARYE